MNVKNLYFSPIFKVNKKTSSFLISVQNLCLRPEFKVKTTNIFDQKLDILKKYTRFTRIRF